MFPEDGNRWKVPEAGKAARDGRVIQDLRLRQGSSDNNNSEPYRHLPHARHMAEHNAIWYNLLLSPFYG